MSNSKSEQLKLKFLVIAIIFLLITCFFLAINNPDFRIGLSDFFADAPTLDSEADFIKILDVGEGDSLLLCSNGQSVLIDAGTESGNNDLCSKIRSVGITSLDCVFITHFHEDHIGGLKKISERFKISNIILPDLYSSDEEYVFAAKTVKNDILNDGGKAYTLKQGMVAYCGDFEITVIGYYGDLSEENDRSAFIMIKYDDIKFLVTGDAEKAAEKRLIQDNINFDCDILKVGHHGSDSSTSKEFLEIATPDYAVISCGAGNRYYHPHTNVLSRLENKNAQIYRTDLEGDITFHFYIDEVVVSTQRLVEN